IDIANRAFAPAVEEIAWAQEVIAAFDSPANADRGAIQLGGAMVERLHLDEARRIVRWAAA
nr:hypothetical protein [Tanacetum cinerariifolium]